jgi:hypothetical protein
MTAQPESQPQNAESFSQNLEPSLQGWLDELRNWTVGELPVDAFAACAAAWPEVRERFMEEWRLDLADPSREVVSGALHVVGLYLAAANSDAAFLDILLLGIQLNDDDHEVLFGVLLPDSGPTLMAMMARGSTDTIARLETASLPQPGIEPVLNSIPLEALALLVEKDAYERQRLDELIRRIDSELDQERFDSDRRERRQWTASVLMDCAPGDMLQSVREWFNDGLAHDSPVLNVITLEDVEEAAALTPAERAERWHALRRWESIQTDTYESLRWTMRDEDEIEEDFDDWLNPDEGPSTFGPSLYEEPGMPLVRVEPKIGRNEPCPCGSGKKYKKCCGNS